ncbi:hypothetical protein BDZ89DRAFT_1202469, partial [Hymenopellis radicata]
FGDLPPAQALTIYKSRISSHLSYASEVAIDLRATNLALLEAVEVNFIRRVLHVQLRDWDCAPPLYAHHQAFAVLARPLATAGCSTGDKVLERVCGVMARAPKIWTWWSSLSKSLGGGMKSKIIFEFPGLL